MTSEYKTNLEIERKYIIKMPDFSRISMQDEYTKSDIIQIYLASPKGETHRIRRREYLEKTSYFETRKIRIDEMSVTEIEGEISEEKYNELSRLIAYGTSPVVKTRHTFVYMGQLFEIDVYPKWHSTAIMETELSSREVQVEFPPFIEIVAEVTGDKAYSNAAMSRSFPAEINKK